MEFEFLLYSLYNSIKYIIKCEIGVKYWLDIQLNLQVLFTEIL